MKTLHFTFVKMQYSSNKKRTRSNLDMKHFLSPHIITATIYPLFYHSYILQMKETGI